MPAMQKREVAVSFLFKHDPSSDRPQVALFRRSGAVRTYPHKLAPISGSVDAEKDANPLATALREIKEETTLQSPSDIELLRRGKSYSFADESIGRRWTIHPFAFRLKDGEAGIAIDWEHDGWEWHDPLDVVDSVAFGGVPRLRDSLRRVWPDIDLGARAGGVLVAGLERLQTDHESGARQLASAAVSILRDVVVAMAESGSAAAALDGTWWARIRMAAWHIWKNGRESMGAAIVSALVATLVRVREAQVESLSSSHDLDQQLSHVLGAIDDCLAQRQLAVGKIQRSFLQLIKDRVSVDKPVLRVLTLSSSSTISSCLLQAANDLGSEITLDVRILESRPLCEGVTLASKLLFGVHHTGHDDGVRFRIALYSDASAALASKDVDLVLMGADRISAAGDVSNKTGSLPAVLSAKHMAPDTQVVVVSEVDKVAGPGEPSAHAAEENDVGELTEGWRQSAVKGADIVLGSMASSAIEVKNIYFEWVPARLIDAYITEKGVWSVNEIRERSDWIGAEMKRFFGDL